MTVETSARKELFAGGQGSLTFTFKTLVDYPEYIKAKAVLIADGTETDLTYTSEYTVSVNSDGVGGTVTISPTFSTAYYYTIYRETGATQTTDYDDYNQFPADTLEADLDRAIMLSQEATEELGRTIRFPISVTGASTTLPSPEAETFLRWNSAGTAIENASIPDPATIVKASTADAQAATDDSDYMTPAKVKTTIEYAGAVSVPIDNIPVVTVTKGGTNITAYSQGDTVYASAANTLAKLPKVSSATRYLSNRGPSNNPSWSTVNLSNGVDGLLHIKNINATGTTDSTTFLRGDGTWSVPVTASSIAYAAGDNIIESADTERTETSTTYTKKKEIRIAFGGTLRFKFDLHAAGTAGRYAQAYVYRNGVQVGVLKQVDGAAYVTQTDDISGWSPGDLAQLYLRMSTTTGSQTAYVRNFRLYADPNYLTTVVTD